MIGEPFGEPFDEPFGEPFGEPCLGLLRLADKLRNRDPKRAVEIAKSARDLAAGVDRESVGCRRWLALQAEAWATLGSAYRGVADLRQAEGALNVALAFLSARELEPPLDPFAFASLAQRASYLRCDQGRYPEALDLNEEALDRYRELAATQQMAGALVDRALILGRCGRFRLAMACLVQALSRLDPVASPRSYLAAVHNMAIYLHEGATTREHDLEAKKWLALAARQHARLPERVNLLKLRMLEASIAIRLGSVAEGVAKLWRAHDGFERLGSVHNQILVLLQLAALSLKSGETREVKRIAGKMFPIFRKLKVDRETSASLMLFCRAAQADAATLDLLDRVTRKVEEGRRTFRIRPG